MRVVLDTNVVVAGLLSSAGPPGWIMDLFLAGNLELIVDNRILGEYRDVLCRRELSLSRAAVEQFLAAVERCAVLITAQPWPQPPPDADDEPFIAVAAAAQAVIVTGNLKHFPQHIRAQVSVLTPRQFMDLLRQAR